MTLKKIGIALVLVDFTALTLYAMFTESPTAIIDAVTHNWWSVQIAIDLVIAATIGGVWLYRDAKARGLNPMPWLAMLPFIGSLALLGYLVRRNLAPAREVSLRTT
jgi:hypothetical protein